jgi:hypothetical protein
MAPERRRQLLLAVLVVILAGVAYTMWPRTSGTPGSSSNGKSASGVQATAKNPAVGVPDVHLDALNADRPEPESNVRNPFRFKPKAAPPPPASAEARSGGPLIIAPAGPAGPPALPPIPLKFIAMLETPEHQKIAVLNDGRGLPIYGSEGQTVLGQYRILHIGTESIEMAYLDGRGRQTIRLSGS